MLLLLACKTADEKAAGDLERANEFHGVSLGLRVVKYREERPSQRLSL